MIIKNKTEKLRAICRLRYLISQYRAMNPFIFNNFVSYN